MNTTYPITEEQIRILNSFTCQRLTEDPENWLKIQHFENKAGRGMVYHLQTDAWSIDKNGYPAVYYVVKDSEGRIVMFFSLKCGVLFNTDFVKNTRAEYERYNSLISSLGNTSFTEKMRQELLELQMSRDKYHTLLDDISRDRNPNHIHVSESHPAIELVELCINSRERKVWEKCGMDRHSMGETLFWWFIVPKIMEISALVGCEYLYAFVPDDSAEGRLINYYEGCLHFERMTDLGTAKPVFDFLCPMMCQRIHQDDSDHPGLAEHRQAFFDMFNLNYDCDDLV